VVKTVRRRRLVDVKHRVVFGTIEAVNQVEGVSDLVIPHQIAPPKLHNIRALIVGAV
jgi:hypothetical protein